MLQKSKYRAEVQTLGLLFFFCMVTSSSLAQDNAAQGQQASGGDTSATSVPKWAEPERDLPQSNSESQEDEFSLAEEADRLQVESSRGVRRFHEVLNDLLIEFGYDVQQGQLTGLKNLAIRQVNLNESLPRSYENYLELLVTERVREHSNIRLISCLVCKTRSSSMVDGKLYITSPRTNISRLNNAADQLGIQHFMDITLVYHSTHMVLAFQIFDVRSKELIWTRTYNSETMRSRFQNMAVDYSQVAKSRKSDEYVPEYKLLVGFAAAILPNIGGTTDDNTMMGLQVRAVERFNRRKHDFGLLLNVLSSTNTLLGGAAAESEELAEGEEKPIKPYTLSMALFAVYGYNLIGAVESYNEIRHGFHVGVGPFLALSFPYYAPAARVGWDSYFGRRWVLGLSAMYVGASHVVIDKEVRETDGGLGGDFVISFNF